MRIIFVFSGAFSMGDVYERSEKRAAIRIPQSKAIGEYGQINPGAGKPVSRVEGHTHDRKINDFCSHDATLSAAYVHRGLATGLLPIQSVSGTMKCTDEEMAAAQYKG
jgi:hypothetical protein